MPFKNQKLKILYRLDFLYGPEKSQDILAQIGNLCQKHSASPGQGAMHIDEKDILLITYGDTVQSSPSPPLKTLRRFLNKWVGDAISFLHILPFFPYTSDDGFSVVDYRQVDKQLGAWEDIGDLSRDYRLVFDAVVNHVSASSMYMKRQCQGDPLYADFLLTANPAVDLSSVLRPRNLPLLHKFATNRGFQWFWTTFS